MAGLTPLNGLNDDRLGPRFFAMHDAYDSTLQRLVQQAAEQLHIAHKVRAGGVYCYLAGPSYETPAECRFLRQLGDIVGMSTVPEVLAARHCGMKVLGLSLVTATPITEPQDAPTITHDDVMKITQVAGQDVERLLRLVLRHPSVHELVLAVPEVDTLPPKANVPSKTGCACARGCGCGKEAMRGAMWLSVACAVVSVACLVYTLRRRY